MYSLNVPLSGTVQQRIEALRPELSGFDQRREEPTLVAKRFGRLAPDEFERIESEVRLQLAGVPTFEVSADGLRAFEAPPSGPAPVVYLAVESPDLERLHTRLVETFGAIEGVEGENYVPHITLARGGTPESLDRLIDTPVEPVTWTVNELWFWDARRGERAGRVSLPA